MERNSIVPSLCMFSTEFHSSLALLLALKFVNGPLKQRVVNIDSCPNGTESNLPGLTKCNKTLQ